MLAAAVNVSQYANASPARTRCHKDRTGRAPDTTVEDAAIGYWIFAITFCSFAMTAWGSAAYESAAVIFWPSVNIQARKSRIAFFLVASGILSGISSHVKLEIGYASLPGALVIDTRKSSGISLTLPAAAVTLARLASTNAPAGFFTLP